MATVNLTEAAKPVAAAVGQNTAVGSVHLRAAVDVGSAESVARPGPFAVEELVLGTGLS